MVFIRNGPIIAPSMPVIITNAATKIESAPMILATSEATGIVIDLIVKETSIKSDKLSKYAMNTAERIVETIPAIRPDKAGTA